MSAQQPAAALPSDPLDTPSALAHSADVNQATGRRDYDGGDVMGIRSAEFDGASVCMYGFGQMFEEPAPPMITVGIAAAGAGGGATAQLLGEAPRAGCEREAVAGLGRVAVVEACADEITLYADVAAYELLIGIGRQPALSAGASRAALVTLARTAAAKLGD